VSLRLAGCLFQGMVSYDRIEGRVRGSNSRIGRLVGAGEDVPIDTARRVVARGNVAVLEVGGPVVSGSLT
jgi:hypothetical protein